MHEECGDDCDKLQSMIERYLPKIECPECLLPVPCLITRKGLELFKHWKLDSYVRLAEGSAGRFIEEQKLCAGSRRIMPSFELVKLSRSFV